MLFSFQTNIYSQPNKTTAIVINNTFGIGVELETKCDFDNKIGNYTYYKRIIIPKRTRKVLRVPVGLKMCEIWVLNVFIFGSP
jgi:hypothetical protein